MLAGSEPSGILSLHTPALFSCLSSAPEADLRDFAAPSCLLGIPNCTAGNLGPQFLCRVGLSAACVREGACLNKPRLSGFSLRLCKTLCQRGQGSVLRHQWGLFYASSSIPSSWPLHHNVGQHSVVPCSRVQASDSSIHFPVWIICERRKQERFPLVNVTQSCSWGG